MSVVLCFVIFLLFLRLVISVFSVGSTARYKAESMACFVACFGIVFLAAFRGETVGTDTLGYISDYIDVETMSFSDIAERYEGYVGYYYPSKVFTMIGIPIWGWFGFVELIYISSIWRLIKKYSSDRLYSCILFMVTGLFMFSLAGLKQTLAMALILHSYLDLVEKRYVRSILLVIITFFVHPAALIMLLAFFLYLIRGKKYYPAVVAIVVATIVIGGMFTVSTLVSLLGNDHFETYLVENNTYSRSTLYLYILMLVCSVPFMLRYIKWSETGKLELGYLLIACSFQYLSSFSPNLFRLAFLFTPFYLVYLPNVFEAGGKSDLSRILLKTVALLGPIVFYAYANRGFVYTFSW